MRHLIPQRPLATAITSKLCLCSALALPLTVLAAPTGCEITVSAPELNLGKLYPYEINPKGIKTGLISLNKQINTLNVVCAQPTRFAIDFRATASADGSYRFNTQPDAATFKLTMTQVSADNKPASWGSRQDATRNAAKMPLLYGDAAYPLIDGKTLPITRLVASVEMETLLEANLLHGSSDRDLSGEGVFEIISF